MVGLRLGLRTGQAREALNKVLIVDICTQLHVFLSLQVTMPETRCLLLRNTALYYS